MLHLSERTVIDINLVDMTENDRLMVNFRTADPLFIKFVDVNGEYKHLLEPEFAPDSLWALAAKHYVPLVRSRLFAREMSVTQVKKPGMIEMRVALSSFRPLQVGSRLEVAFHTLLSGETRHATYGDGDTILSLEATTVAMIRSGKQYADRM